MLLQQLRLQNIRSYLDQTIDFPEGTTLLSGDIGSGKSTILLAIEFALFGSSRPELPAESLLRKGAAKGTVELTFSINGQTITVQRHLKKEKDAIKQMPGYIIYNNTKKELMPVELKAEILTLLGYPEDLLSKNKNYIFRYTIYTPQEEMKLILQDSSEIRLDVLRKIFNIDRYKIIRENLQIHLKKMRMDLAVLSTKIEPIAEYTFLLEQRKEEQQKIAHSLQEVTPLAHSIQEQRKLQQQQLERLEQQQKEYLHLQQQIASCLLLEKEINGNLQQINLKKELLNKKIAELAVPKDTGISSAAALIELRQEEKKREQVLKEKNELEGKIKNLQHLIALTQQDLHKATAEISSIPELERRKEQLLQEIAVKKGLVEKKAQIDLLLVKTLGLIVKNKTILAQSEELQETMQGLENCPTCLQEVPAEHKHKITAQEQAKNAKAKILLTELEKKKQEISSQKEALERQILNIFSKENNLAKVTVEIQQLQKKELWIKEKKEQLRQLVQENNSLMVQQQTAQLEQKIEQAAMIITEKQKFYQALSHKEILDKNLHELSIEKEEKIRKKEQLQQQQEKLQALFTEKKDTAALINAQKQKVMELLEQEREAAVKIAQLQTQLESIKRHLQEIEERVDLLKKEKEKLLRMQELYHWLEEHLLPLTYTIEKQMMINLHHHFDQLFQEWFSILIEDLNTFSRLDDSFAPVIMQNGYEVSFHDLSGGEKTSAALAYRLALNKVINTLMHTINTKDLLILDEPTDGFSAEQLDKVRDVLDKLQSRQTIIVSHESKVESFVDRVVRISKENHVSAVMQ
ncbi:MAG: SMC family ATPase [Nanoarchaeota archaeon]|nr:SMC family ATPase [Nanoarchaeota archaeon]